ncbi:hypothetical protein [Pigmentiphaga sp.]|jgi:hypothetical protein|uniref:hypothetical protein n=1 Tax=Pigmentiphaga sp. TaxID=1977564 RepID=UPI0025CD7CD1|nr:hypothetical protein [Pigmentiphaga sp.]MBX6317302.1 hypothetical protein [Pigmentiphaga sp.]
MKTALALLLAFVSSAALAKLPAPSPEAKAKAAEAAARAAWSAKVDSYKLCQAQNRVASAYFANLQAAGKPMPQPVATPACADPGPFTYTPPEDKPLEAAGAHSPSGTASSPHNTKTPDAASEPKQ